MLDDTEISELFSDWGRVWGVWKAGPGVLVKFSTRMRRRLGSCNPSRRTIILNGVLAAGENRDVAIEVLCHEAAHLAVYDLHGRGAKPHGVEWKSLMRAVSLEPTVRFAAERIAGLPPVRRRGKYVYLHVCGDCRKSFTTSRTDRRWRCRACYVKGRGGRLRVTRSPALGG